MTEPPVDPDLLNGWKEIASWSGKSVRSVQRWERDLGLPVHRIKTPDGQSVYARRSELDEWRASLDVQKVGVLHEPSDEDASDEGAADAGSLRKAVRRPVTLGLVIGAAAVVAAVAFVMWLPTAGSEESEAVSFELGRQGIRAMSGSGRTVWQHEFAYPVLAAGVVSQVDPIRVDLDGDGRAELLAAIKHGERLVKTRAADVLLCLDDTGQPCWEVRPELSFTCGGEVFGAPWQIGDVAIVERGGVRKVWASFVHHTWWPSFVLEIDPDGSTTLIYFQAGWVVRVAEWRTASASYLVAGGVSNAHQRASVAFVRTDAFPASSLMEEHAGGCDDVPPARAERIIVLPSFEVQVRAEPYPFVMNLQQLGAILKVGYEGSDAAVVAELGDDFELRRLARSDAYWMSHRRFELSGLIDHPAGECPEHTAGQELLVWTSRDGWQSQTIIPDVP